MFRTTGRRLGVFAELFAMLWAHKLWWLIPMVCGLMVLGALLVFAQSSPLAPFIYTLF